MTSSTESNSSSITAEMLIVLNSLFSDERIDIDLVKEFIMLANDAIFKGAYVEEGMESGDDKCYEA